MYIDTVKPKRDFLVGKMEKTNENNYEKQQELIVIIMDYMFNLEHSNHTLYCQLLGIIFSDYIRMNIYESSKIDENPDLEFIAELEEIKNIEDLEYMIMEDGELLYKFLQASSNYNLMNDLEKANANLSVGNNVLGRKILQFNPEFILENLAATDFYNQDIEDLSKKYDHDFCVDYLTESKKRNRVNFLSNLKKMVKVFYAWKFALSNHISIEPEAINMLKRIETYTVEELEAFLIEFPELLDYLLETYELHLSDEHIVKNETVFEETISKARTKVIKEWLT